MENEHQILSSKTIKNSGAIENVGSEIHVLSSKLKKVGQASNFIFKNVWRPIENVRSEFCILIIRMCSLSHFTYYYIS